MRSKKELGFTLIELLIVIAIILILIAIALPNFLEAQIRAKVVKSGSELRTYETAMMSYFIDNEIYPRDHDSAWPYASPNQNGFQMLTTPLSYLTSLPFDPFGSLLSTGDEIGNTGVPRNISFHYEGGSGSDSNACGGPNLPYQAGSPQPFNAALARECFQAYLLIGVGPDSDDSTNGNDDFPYAGPSSPVSLTSYSPTNGTKSRGDIYKLLGEWKRGWVALDGIVYGGPVN